jgi:putative two-component system response regulator
MPGASGLDLCRRIYGENWPGYVYILILTAHDRIEDVVENLSAGADDFVSKPFNLAELHVRIRAGERVLSLETRDVAIFSMAKLAESRDPETGMYLERMRSFSRVLARMLMEQGKDFDPIDAEYAHTLFLTNPLHDIGKAAIPDSVLLKPGRLSDEEFEIMKTHSVAGAETLGAAAQQYPGVA